MAICEKDLIDIAQGLLVPIIAILGVYIAWQQWNTNNNRLKHEYFDRRFSIYEIVVNFFTAVVSRGSTKEIDILQFIGATKSAKFIFPAEIYEFMDKAFLKFSDLESIDAELEGTEKGEERSALVKQRREIRDWFHDELLVIDSRFQKNMKLVG